MKYRNKHNGKIVTIIKTEDNYIYFRLDGIEQIVNAKRFYSVYEEVQDE